MTRRGMFGKVVGVFLAPLLARLAPAPPPITLRSLTLVPRGDGPVVATSPNWAEESFYVYDRMGIDMQYLSPGPLLCSPIEPIIQWYRPGDEGHPFECPASLGCPFETTTIFEWDDGRWGPLPDD